MPGRADRDVGERDDHQRCSLGALPQCPVRLGVHAPPQRAVTRRAGPSAQRRPPLGPAHASRRPRTRARLRRGVGQHRAAPQLQRERDRRRGVATMRELAARPHRHHRPARAASVAPLQQRAQHASAPGLGVRGAPPLPRPQAVAAKHHLPGRRQRRHPAAWASRWPTRIDPRWRLLPGLDVEIEVNDMTLVLGVDGLHLLLRRGLGRAVLRTPTRPPSSVRAPARRPYPGRAPASKKHAR